MKIRNGFVSNSSSSSYLFVIPWCVNDIDDFFKYIKDQYHYIVEENDFLNQFTTSFDYDQYKMTNKECLEKLWFDIHSDNSHIVNEDDMKDWYRYANNWFKPHPKGIGDGYWLYKYCDEYNTPDFIAEMMSGNFDDERKLSDKLQKQANKWNDLLAKSIMKDFFETSKTYGRIYQVTYSDNSDDIGVQMEHGDFWSVVDNLCISQH